jgi:hypothetical protein
MVRIRSTVSPESRLILGSVGGWAFGHSSHSQFFWEEDIHVMHEKLVQLHKDIAMNKHNARANLETFKKETAEIIAQTQEALPASRAWLREYLISKSEEKQGWHDRRKAE